VQQRGPISVCFFLLVAAQWAPAQVQVGNLNANVNGTLSAGYTGDFGNLTPSDHGVTFGGAGTVSGFYYNPNFLSFSVQPFLNQSRENSNYQSISDTSGVSASTSIFAGSNFPGTVSYSKNFNSQGNFAVPGVADFTSHGNSQVLNVGWSENVPKLPSVSVSFLDGADNYSLYGASGDLSSTYRSILAQSTYRVAGFSLNGNFRDSTAQSEVPEILGGAAETTDSETRSFSFGIGHRLPFNGSFSASANRSEISAGYPGGNYGATLDSLNGGLSFSPVTNLNFGANFQYTDNLAASLDQTILSAGGTVEGTPQESSHAMTVTGFANYTLPAIHVILSGSDEHREQVYLGQSYASDAYTGSATYSNSFLGGFLNATVGAAHTAVSTSDQSMLGLTGSLNYSRQIKAWSVSGMVHYAQNTQTALIAYTSNGYGYSASVGRKLGGKSHWSGSAAGSRGTLSNQPGAATFSQSYSSVLSVKWIGVSGSYSKSSGNSILTSSGLVPVTVPLPVVAPSLVILYGGQAYSAGVGLTPARGITFSASYSRAISSTHGDSISSNNKTDQLNAYLQYKIRKIYLTAGFSKLTQSFSTNGNAPAMIASYYFGISRWFSFF
jgi:hypothetical protein